MDDDLLATARTIRPYLSTVLAEDDAARMDAILADLLARARGGDDVDSELAAALSVNTSMRALAAAIVADPAHRPPRVREVRLPGDGELVDMDRFVCAEGDFVWYRVQVGQVIPQCPSHAGPLVRG